MLPTEFRDLVRKELDGARADAVERLIGARGEAVPYEQGYLRGIDQAVSIFSTCFSEMHDVMEDA